MRIHPIYGYWKMHKGIDIGASYGTDILSSADGVVTLVADDKDGYGLYIVVYHGDGISTLYAHCSKIIAKVGQSVKQGQVIALVGDTGASTSPHIHYEVRVNGAHTDPLKYVKP
jgi:murein DD-endopeptidase MepM/ murein hydrolase activator NlpD